MIGSEHGNIWSSELEDLPPFHNDFQEIDWALVDHEGNDADSMPALDYVA